MRKSVPFLSGLAILAVVMNHANYNVLREFAPGAANVLPALPYLLIDQLHKFGVPAFVFITGYFIAYAAGGERGELKWSVVQARLPWLIIPWVVWATVHFIGQTIQGRPPTIDWYLRTLFIQYYFIPLLLFYYLLSLPVVRLAKSNPRRLLIIAAAIQFTLVLIYTARTYLSGFPPEWRGFVDLGPMEYLRFAFYFPLGVVTGMYPQKARDLLAPWKKVFPWAIPAAYLLQVAEAVNAFRMGGDYILGGGDQTRFASILYALAILLTFISRDGIKYPFRRQFAYLSSNSLGLYLSHYILVGILTDLLDRLLPGVVGWGFLQMLIVFAGALGISILMMEVVRRIPIRGLFRYFFG